MFRIRFELKPIEPNILQSCDKRCNRPVAVANEFARLVHFPERAPRSSNALASRSTRTKRFEFQWCVRLSNIRARTPHEFLPPRFPAPICRRIDSIFCRTQRALLWANRSRNFVPAKTPRRLFPTLRVVTNNGLIIAPDVFRIYRQIRHFPEAVRVLRRETFGNRVLMRTRKRREQSNRPHKDGAREPSMRVLRS